MLYNGIGIPCPFVHKSTFEGMDNSFYPDTLSNPLNTDAFKIPSPIDQCLEKQEHCKQDHCHNSPVQRPFIDEAINARIELIQQLLCDIQCMLHWK